MNPTFLRNIMTLAALLFSLCSTVATAESIDETVLALRNLDESIANQQLGQAESQLQTLQQRIPGDTRLDQARRAISAAYVRQGQAEISNANFAAATQALENAQRILPAGSAPTGELSAAIEQIRAQQQTLAAENAAKAKALAEAETNKAEQARQQKLAAERLASNARKAAEAAEAAEAASLAAPKAVLVDPAAPSSRIALPMLETNDTQALRTLLDQVAVELVGFNCKVKIEVRENKDYPRVASLLSARVKKIDPAFNLQLEPVINPANAPQLVLYPQS